MKRYLPLVIIVGVLAGAVVAGVVMFQSAQPKPVTTTAPVIPASSSPIAKSKGFVTLEEFGDYQCPPCGYVHPMLKKVKLEYGEKVRFFFYHYPLVLAHKNALTAAHAAVAAAQQQRFVEMHDLLYQNQKLWSEAEDLRPIAAGFAQQLGLDVKRFVSDLDSPNIDALVSQDVARATARGVNATPTIFLDGQAIKNETMTLESLRQEINQRLGLQ